MARSAQRNKRQPPQQPEQPGPTAGRSASAPPQRSYEDEMFFPRLRRQAKWMFVVLALVFGLGYVIFNVGGTIPGTGLGDILQNAGGGDGRPTSATRRTRCRTTRRSRQAKLELADALHAERPARRGDPRARAVPRPAAARRRRRQPARRPVHGPGRAPPAGGRARAGRGCRQPRRGRVFAPPTGLVTQLRGSGRGRQGAVFGGERAAEPSPRARPRSRSSRRATATNGSAS